MTHSSADDSQPTTVGGAPVYHHRDAEATSSADPVAPRDEARRRACEAHLTEFLGDDFDLLTEKVAVGIHLDLYVFRPTKQFPHITVVTSGMSDAAMNVPDGFDGDRLELMIALPAGWPGIDPLDANLLRDEANYWPIRMLKDVARIPSTYDSFVTWGHTISDEEQSLFAPGLSFCGAIVGPPLGYPPLMMRAVTPVGEVDYLAVFPTTQSEMDYKVATPDGGDALIDKFMDHRVTMVIDPERQSVASPPPWSLHVLMKNRAEHLGEVLDEALPNRAAALTEERVVDSVVPAANEQEVHMRVSGPILPQQLLADAADSGLSDQQTEDLFGAHHGVVTVAPVVGGGGNQFATVLVLAAMVAERSDALAVWLPAQHYVTTAAQFVQETMDGELYAFRVHPTQAPAGHTAVMTKGLVALGGREVFWSADDLDHDDLVRRMKSALERIGDAPFTVPQPGEQLRYGFSRFELREDTHPITGEPVLAVGPREKRKRGLFGRRG